MPVDVLEIEDTWKSAGLRGTGSHHVNADSVAITLDRCCTFADRPWPALCDVQAARQHLLFSHKHLPELAKPLAGLDSTSPPFIV